MKIFLEDIFIKCKSAQCLSILDLGCGHCAVTSELQYFKMTGVDLDPQEIQQAKSWYSDAIVLDARDALKHFGEKSFDAVISLDFLEHLEMEDSIKVVEDSEKIARKLVVHFTPQDANLKKYHAYCDEPGLMAHKCSWTEEEFRSRGYAVKFFDKPFHHFLATKKIKC